MTEEDLTRYFGFLDALRLSGSINMFGAAQPLSDLFDLEMPEARKVHMLWMNSFDDSPASERAQQCLSCDCDD
jgi:hypothetical protein